MTTKFQNELKIHMLGIHESVELAESKAKEYEERFTKLDKYDTMMVDYIWSLDGFDKALKEIDKLYEQS
jgi:hypothetical protein